MPKPVLTARKRRAVEAVAGDLAFVKCSRGREKGYIRRVLTGALDILRVDLERYEILIANRKRMPVTCAVNAQVQFCRVLL